MHSFDVDKHLIDPALFAPQNAGLDVRADPQAPACLAAVSNHRVALTFRVMFTLLVWVVSAASAAALVAAIWILATTSQSTAGIVTGVAGLTGSGGVVFLVSRMNKAIRAAEKAIGDVGKYCGAEVRGAIEAGE
jgi:hypothetical protein